MTDKAREPAEVSRPLTGYLWGGIGGAELPLSFADSCHRADRNGCRRFSRGLLGNRGYRTDRLSGLRLAAGPGHSRCTACQGAIFTFLLMAKKSDLFLHKAPMGGMTCVLKILRQQKVVDSDEVFID